MLRKSEYLGPSPDKQPKTKKLKSANKKETKVPKMERDAVFTKSFEGITENFEYKLMECIIVSADDYEEYFDIIVHDFLKIKKYFEDCSPFLSENKISCSQEVLGKLKLLTEIALSTFFPSKLSLLKEQPKRTPNLVIPNIPSTSKYSNKKTDRLPLVPRKTTVKILDCGFENMENKMLRMNHFEVMNRGVMISNLKNCRVEIYGSSYSVNIRKADHCTILLGPVSTFLFVEECNNCIFCFAADRITINSTIKSKLYLHAKSFPVIEDCKELEVAPYSWSYKNIMVDFTMAKLDPNVNKWNLIRDFNWLASSDSSPNWSVIKTEERVLSWDI